MLVLYYGIVYECIVYVKFVGGGNKDVEVLLMKVFNIVVV